MMASQPLDVFTPSCKGSRIVLARSEMRSTATLLVMRRIVSPTAIGRRVPLGLRRAMMDAPHTKGRTDSGTPPCKRRLTTSVMRRMTRSDESSRIASRIWEGRSPERPCEPDPHQRQRRPVTRHGEGTPCKRARPHEVKGEEHAMKKPPRP